jgi:hypothetical protein
MLAQDYIDACAGDYTLVVIDDSGTPGATKQSEYHDPDAAVWTAVVIRPDIAPHLLGEFYRIYWDIRRQLGVKELHFTDILMRRGPYKKVDPKLRESIIEQLGELFLRYRVPVIVSRLEADRVDTFRETYRLVDDKYGVVDVSQAKGASFYRLLELVAKHLRRNQRRYRKDAVIFVDEGMHKAGRSFHLQSSARNYIKKNGIHIGTTEHVVPLQLADFAACIIGRMQWLSDKPKRSDYENDLQINFNHITAYAENVTASPPLDPEFSQTMSPEYFHMVTFDDERRLSQLPDNERQWSEKKAHSEIARCWRRFMWANFRNYFKLLWLTQVYLARSVKYFLTKHWPPGGMYWLNGTVISVLRFSQIGPLSMIVRGYKGRELVIINNGQATFMSYSDLTVPELQTIEMWRNEIKDKGAPGALASMMWPALYDQIVVKGKKAE